MTVLSEHKLANGQIITHEMVVKHTSHISQEESLHLNGERILALRPYGFQTAANLLQPLVTFFELLPTEVLMGHEKQLGAHLLALNGTLYYEEGLSTPATTPRGRLLQGLNLAKLYDLKATKRKPWEKVMEEVWPEPPKTFPELLRFLSRSGAVGPRLQPYLAGNTLYSTAAVYKLKEEELEDLARITLCWFVQQGVSKQQLDPKQKVSELHLPETYKEHFTYTSAWSGSKEFALHRPEVRKRLLACTVEELQALLQEAERSLPVNRLLVLADQVAERVRTGKKKAVLTPEGVEVVSQGALALWRAEAEQAARLGERPKSPGSVFYQLQELAQQESALLLLAEGGIKALTTYRDFEAFVACTSRQEGNGWLRGARHIPVVVEELLGVMSGEKAVQLILAARTRPEPLTVVDWANVARQWETNTYEDLPAAWVLQLVQGEALTHPAILEAPPEA